jgi:hypothetical protein
MGKKTYNHAAVAGLDAAVAFDFHNGPLNFLLRTAFNGVAQPHRS